MSRRFHDLPPSFVERAITFERTGEAPAAPRDASTVVVLRDGDRGPEVYLLRRVMTMAFAAGMYVFPGGRVDPADGAPDVRLTGPSRDEWAERLGTPPALAAAAVCAAVRETFEESGVLLAGPPDGPPVADTTGADWERDRAALVDRSLGFAAFLRRRDLVVRADLLAAWARWVTPEFEERRYDTRFFVAALPAGQVTRDVGGEADRVTWLRPADALAGYERGELALLPPTVVTLTELAAYPDVAAVLAAAPSRTGTPIVPVAQVLGARVELVVPGPGETA